MLGLERVQQLRVVRLTGYRSVVIDLELLDRELQSLRIFRRIPDVTCVVAEIAETGLNARHLGHRIEVADPQRFIAPGSPAIATSKTANFEASVRSASRLLSWPPLRRGSSD